jgi:excisionase family DNA binding protein
MEYRKEDYVGIEAVAQHLNVPKSWVYGQTRTGTIPHYKIGKYCKFRLEEIQEWMQAKHVG